MSLIDLDDIHISDSDRETMANSFRNDLVNSSGDNGEENIYALSKKDMRKFLREQEGEYFDCEKERTIDPLSVMILLVLILLAPDAFYLLYHSEIGEVLIADSDKRYVLSGTLIAVSLIALYFGMSYKPDLSPADTGRSSIMRTFMVRISNIGYHYDFLWSQYEKLARMISESGVSTIPEYRDDLEWNRKISDIAVEAIKLDVAISRYESYENEISEYEHYLR